MQVLLEYVRTLLGNELPVLERVQSLMLEIIFMKKLFPMLLVLIQYYSLSDNFHLAEALLKLGTQGQSKYIIGIFPKNNYFLTLL